MFTKLKEVFKKFIENASALLTSKGKLVELAEELKLELVSHDLAYDVAEEIISEIIHEIRSDNIRNKEQLVKKMREMIIKYFNEAGTLDLLDMAKSRKILKIVFLGVNGVGKTTTIAKVGVFLKDHGLRPLMIAADTFRAGAQEQLKKHSEKSGIPVFLGKYGADPASVAYDGIAYGLNRGFNVFLIDTAGRMHTDIDLINELRKIVRVVKPDLKVLIVDALTGNDAIEQARFFHDAVGVDAVIITKVDAYEEGGVPLSIAYVLRKPIIFIGVGQDYKDLKIFNPFEYVEKIIPGLKE
ncbi:MAG: signal recognition particle-docking protein FtsY [Desulfurococcaceae archaeon]